MVRSAATTNVILDDWFGRLRGKWHEIPGDVDGERLSSRQLATLTDDRLVACWESIRNAERSRWEMRGWYHTLYQPLLTSARVLDYGSGFGLDALSWAQAGASVTCADIVAENLRVLERLARALGLHHVCFLHIEDLSSLCALEDESFDVIWAQGSLHHAPFDFMKQEVACLVPKLRIGGRWIQLAYPRERWVRDGAVPFARWGVNTDGEGTPWAEWYDLPKVLSLLAPRRFDPVLAFNFHDDDFNWFDLLRRS